MLHRPSSCNNLLHAHAGGALIAAAVIGAAVVLCQEPGGGKCPGVLALLSHYSRGLPPELLQGQIKLMLTAVLDSDSQAHGNLDLAG